MRTRLTLLLTTATALTALLGCSTDRELNVDADTAFTGQIDGRAISGAGSMDFPIGEDECATVTNIGGGHVRIYITTRQSGFPASTNKFSNHIEVLPDSTQEICGDAALRES